MRHRWIVVLAIAALSGSGAVAGTPRRFDVTTKSAEAKQLVQQLQRQFENLQFGPVNEQIARKIVALDPDFALGAYYLSSTVQPGEAAQLLQRAVELSARASDGERRLIAAMVLVRGDKLDASIPAFRALAKDYPGERVVHSLFGQVLAAVSQVPEAKVEFEKAIAIDGTTPRAYSFLGDLHVVEEQYERARATYRSALKYLPAGMVPGTIRFGEAFTYLYEDQPDTTLERLRAFLAEYRQAGRPLGQADALIWNAIGRINLEYGRADAAMEAYQKGYESLSGSGLDDVDRQVWIGRFHHGEARTWARMGRFDEAWKEAGIVRSMIDAGGEQAKDFEASYHYLAGYIRLEQGDAVGATQELTQARPEADPFRGLLLARAYERAGGRAEAEKNYERVIRYGQNSLERALSHSEAKRRLLALRSGGALISASPQGAR